jgi:hypothetical protein
LHGLFIPLLDFMEQNLSTSSGGEYKYIYFYFCNQYSIP